MPLIVGPPVALIAPEQEGAEVVARQTPGTMTATWIDPTGTEWPLTVTDIEPGWFTTFAVAGWGATPIELVTDPHPRGGERVRYIRSKPRVIQWPLYVGGETHTEFVQRYRDIMRAFTMTTYKRTPGALVIARPNGQRRLIEAFYQQGFEGEAGENWLFAKPVVSLYCPDGYFADGETTTITRTFDMSTQKPFLAPFITVSRNTVVDDTGGRRVTTVANSGDVEAWPQWTLTGPFDAFTTTNTTTGQRFRFAYTAAAGVRVVISTDPMMARAYATPGSTTGANVSRYIDWFNPAGTALWPLMPGNNLIDFQLDGAGVGTGVAMSWRPRYESA